MGINIEKKIVIKRSLYAVIITIIGHLIGKISNRIIVSYEMYKRKNSDKYTYTYSRLPTHMINDRNSYVNIGAKEYKDVNSVIQDQESKSQYYLYKNIIGLDAPVKVCNIGAFYCAADYNFVSNSEQSEVYALDFGDMEKLNSELKHDRLNIRSGYPLELLEDLLSLKGEMYFDYTIFVRTAVLMNKNELNSYLYVVSKISKKIAFFEVVDVSTFTSRNIELNSISIDNPLKMYGGMYIHNYVELAKKFGYNITNYNVLPPGSFPQESANGHHMLCVVGEKSK